MVGTLVNLNNKIKYSKCPNLILNMVFYLYSSLIRSRLYTFGRSKVVNYRALVNLSLNSTINDKG